MTRNRKIRYMDEKQYYVGLDIGTNNVVMVVGSRVAGS